MKLGYREIRDTIFASSCVMQNNQFEILIHKLGYIKNAIELGTFRGISTAVIASRADRVYTFDIEYQPIAKELWEILSINDRIDYKIIKDVLEIKTYLDGIKCDFAFVDIFHTRYELLKNVFNMLRKMEVKKILFDGIMDRFPVGLKLANELNMKIFYERYGYWEIG